MRVKGHRHQLRLSLRSYPAGGGENLLMAEMNAVEIAYRQDAATVDFLDVRYRLYNFHKT